MAKGINKAILIGNLGADPETRYTANGGAVTNIRIATTDQWRDRQSGDQQERTEWHRVVFFGRLAEIAAEYMRKGSQCYVEGRIQTRKWQTQDGQDRYSTEIIANELQFLGGRGSGGNTNQWENQAQTPDSATGTGAQTPEPSRPSAPSSPTDDFDDDIPF